jgi:cell wall-associated NlpC family hydrolase
VRCRPEKTIDRNMRLVESVDNELCREELECPNCGKTARYEWTRPRRSIWVPQEITCLHCKQRGSVTRWEVARGSELPDGGEPGDADPGDADSGSTHRSAFINGVIARVGGRYCTPPRPGCTDCSGLVAEEYFKATGRNITGSSYHQYDLCTPLTAGEVRAGDLVFHHTFGGAVNGNRDSHVGVIINDTERVDAMNPDMGVRRGPRNTPYWYDTYTRAGRLPF